jgi:hypothetical protein
MKPFPITAGLCALGLLVTSAGPLQAAWNNVFQITCHRRGCRSSVAYVQAPVVAAAAPAPCCNPCPQPVCTTRYVQRCYYQPVTCYQTKTYYEPVTTYRTSYYYEPVTSYRYSCYVDPCTGCTQQVACPTTCYQLRAQCCPVQSWVQRCCSVPVTTYQRCCYWEPQTCCTTPPPCCPTNGNGVVQAPAVAVPSAPVVQEQQQFQPQPQPQLQTPPQPQFQTTPPPTIEERKNGGAPGINVYPPPNTPGASFRQPLPGNPVPVRPVSPNPTPAVRPDRIASAPAAQVEGQVVRMDRTPRGGARLTFISAQRQQLPMQAVTANAAGQFQVNLASGGWLVYVTGPDGRQTFHSRIEVNGAQPAPLTVVTR